MMRQASLPIRPTQANSLLRYANRGFPGWARRSRLDPRCRTPVPIGRMRLFISPRVLLAQVQQSAAPLRGPVRRPGLRSETHR